MSNKRQRRIDSWKKYCRYMGRMILTEGSQHLTMDEMQALSGTLPKRRYIYETCGVGVRYHRRFVRLRERHYQWRYKLLIKNHLKSRRIGIVESITIQRGVRNG